MARLNKLDIERAAKSIGYLVRTWSPGDGATRYRFFSPQTQARSKKAYGERQQSYFGPADGDYTAMGAKEAAAFLRGAGAQI